jgi:poly-gamma-glutamate capsule biosynthesis protein CapA/YwtB (metallophosphatase superfamily)
MRMRALCAVATLGASLVACTSEPVEPSTEVSLTQSPTRPGRPDAPSPGGPTDDPSRPESTPAGGRPGNRTPSAEARAGARTTLTVVGDIMLGRRVGRAAAAAGDVAAPLRPLRHRLAVADITVGNLESTLSRDGAPRQGDDSFAAPPSVLNGLAAAGFDVLSLANNHTGDFGLGALTQTLRQVARSPIRGVGAGRDLAAAWRPVVVDRNGVRFGFVAFNAIGETPRARPMRAGAAEVRMQPRTGPLSRPDLRRARRVVRRLAGAADVVVVLPHWGAQYTHTPVPAQRRVGRALVDAGADVVVGGHPHWVQPVQRYRGALVVHSLGNFVFDMDFMRQTQQGVLADLVFTGARLRSVRFTPYVIGTDFAPRPVHGPRARSILRPLGVPRLVRLRG